MERTDKLSCPRQMLVQLFRPRYRFLKEHLRTASYQLLRDASSLAKRSGDLLAAPFSGLDLLSYYRAFFSTRDLQFPWAQDATGLYDGTAIFEVTRNVVETPVGRYRGCLPLALLASSFLPGSHLW